MLFTVNQRELKYLIIDKGGKISLFNINYIQCLIVSI